MNGFSIGKGHLAEAKAAINGNGNGNGHAKTNGSTSVFFARKDGNRVETVMTVNGNGCGSGDTSQRDKVLAKIGRTPA